MTFSAAVSDGRQRTSWKVRAIPARAMRFGAQPAMSWPSSLIEPEDGRRAPEIRLRAIPAGNWPFAAAMPSPSIAG